jgi:hypothetical protein
MKLATLSLSLLAFLFVFSTQVFAVPFTVNQSGDAGDLTCDATCTLRDAVDDANAAVSDDTISFDAGVTNIVLVNSEIVISNNGALTINGPGANVLTIDGGAGTNRIFFSNGATVTISGVTLTGGNGTGINSGAGGAIRADGGTLVLNGVHVTANSSAGGGGGVIFVDAANNQILDSTFSANTAGDCGGFFNVRSTLTVTNSTVSGNSATGLGGGICSNTGGTTLQSVTITGNSAGIGGGGMYQFDGTVSLGNTIVASNPVPSAEDIRREGGNSSLITAGYNLIGNNSHVGVTAEFPAGNPNANQDIVGTSAAPVDPVLGPLTNNGGTTPTHALLAGSPAIDKGNSFGLTTDQRGLTRPVDQPSIPNATGGDGADIGAFEVQMSTAAAVTVGGRVTTVEGLGIAKVRVTLIDSDGAVRSAITNPFGYYAFDEVQAGETYVLSVSSKRYRFANSPRLISLFDSLTDEHFIASP